MADIQFVNNASSILAASINNLDTVIQVSSGDGALFPSPTPPEYFVATLEDDAGNIEVVQVTGRTGDLLTVVRGFDNSVAQSFAMSTTRVELRLTAAVVEEFIQRNGDIMTGALDMDGNEITDAVLDGPNTQILDGEIVGVPLRGDAGDGSNEIVVPSGGGRATAGASDILVAGDDLTGGVAAASETVAGIAEIADQTEADAGTDDTRIMSPKKFRDTAATDTQRGTLRTATIAQTETGTNDNRAVTPEAFAGANAGEGQIGTIEIADQATVDAGTNDTQAVTPLKLANAAAIAGATFRGARGYNAGIAWPIPNHPTIAPPVNPTIEQAFPMNALVFDTEGATATPIYNAGQPTRLTVPAGVTEVRLRGFIQYNFGFTGLRHLRIRKNGSTSGVDSRQSGYVPHISDGNPGSTATVASQIISPVILCTAGDYFELYLQMQNQGATTVNPNAGSFEMEIIK